MYRFEAVSIEGFVQQLAVGYISNGYWFYVTGTIPGRKDPRLTDRKIVDQYGCGVSKWVRARRKRAGLANVQYLRFHHTFVILATRGRHRFFEDEAKRFRDVREVPIKFGGYAIGCKEWKKKFHPSVRIEKQRYREIVARFLKMAIELSVEELSGELRGLPFEPYAPIRRQLIRVLGAINRRRAQAGLEAVPLGALRLRRRPVSPFGGHSASIRPWEVGQGEQRDPLPAGL